MSVPHMRGCSRLSSNVSDSGVISPTYAGMLPGAWRHHYQMDIQSHACGDTPGRRRIGCTLQTSVPHMRGCSSRGHGAILPNQSIPHMRGYSVRCFGSRPPPDVPPAQAGMLPTPSNVFSRSFGQSRICAGMLPTAFHEKLPTPGQSRICGDAPRPDARPQVMRPSIPHMRGGSRSNHHRLSQGTVAPAYVGMVSEKATRANSCSYTSRNAGIIPILAVNRRQSDRHSRICGDAPWSSADAGQSGPSVPHMRGYSQDHVGVFMHQLVPPAYAGMIRRRPRPIPKPPNRSRVGGDVPVRAFRIQSAKWTRRCGNTPIVKRTMASAISSLPRARRQSKTWIGDKHRSYAVPACAEALP